MTPDQKVEWIQRLRIDLLTPGGLGNGKPASNNVNCPDFLKPAFPNKAFPIGASHEFICPKAEKIAASQGFIASLIQTIFPEPRPVVWISLFPNTFAPALKAFGLEPHKQLFIHPSTSKELKWAAEEVLNCSAIGAMVLEIAGLDQLTSKRFQLAVEESRVTGFILNTGKITPNSCVSRWSVSHLPSHTLLPGLGFPSWKVELLRMRNGRPGQWHLEWKDRSLHPLETTAIEQSVRTRKTG